MTIIFFCENLKTGLSSIRHCLLAHLQKRINSVYFVPSVASIPENPYFQSTANGTEDSAGEGKLSSWIAPESLAYCKVCLFIAPACVFTVYCFKLTLWRGGMTLLCQCIWIVSPPFCVIVPKCSSCIATDSFVLCQDFLIWSVCPSIVPALASVLQVDLPVCQYIALVRRWIVSVSLSTDYLLIFLII